jgi:hypothetical protein
LVSMSAIEKSAQTTDHAAVAAANALRLHAHYRGKIATIPKVHHAWSGGALPGDRGRPPPHTDRSRRRNHDDPIARAAPRPT